ncbi:hypothetical protein [Microtetraspora sp. NBRC 16547]|uniref:hypothetical protein n=1 Tax=Microtetraspora sp. NBRC 16547 TaxID=3030993 RepID=UPI0024A22BA9|nr:hypothetical protein [Microtetraspora sp. NBRC 16547]GLW98729.1 hypothetical protein Misp02_28160 [Microtetraspora sp. NBRC 16547]
MRTIAILTRALVLLLIGLIPAGVAGAAYAGTPSPESGTSSASRDQAARVALIGVPGLRWSDLDREATPHLWQLAGESAIGSLSVRAVGSATCPADGWLTVSAGIRSSVGERCLPEAPQAQGQGALVSRTFGADAHADAAGRLGQAIHDAGLCTTAVGPGAALALADHAGRVDAYAATPEDLPADGWSRCPVIAVDVDAAVRPYLASGGLSDEASVPAALRAEAVRAADREVGEVLAKLPADATVLVAGLSDRDRTPHLRVAMLRTPRERTDAAGQERTDAGGLRVGSDSTRRDDMVTLPDITATVLAVAGLSAPGVVMGLPWTASTGHAAPAADAVGELVAADLAGQTVRDMTGAFFTGFAIVQVLFYVSAYLLLRRNHPRGRSVLRAAALAVAALPVSTYLVNMFPWVRAPLPALAVVAGALAFDAAIVCVALAGPWRRALLGPGSVVAAITGLVLVADLVTGTTLQLNGVMGYTGVVGARYYGMGNIPNALFATSVLFLGAVMAQWLIGRGHRRAAVAAVVALGAACVAFEAWPGVGSKFGGTIGFVSAIVVTAVLVAGRRLSAPRLALICAGGATVSLTVAFLDHLRPAADQTHLGRFIGQALDGNAVPQIQQKLEAMLRTFGNANLLPIVVAALAFLVFAWCNPAKVTAGALPMAFARAPMLRAGLAGALVSGVVGTLASDSGIAVLSMTLALAVPLALAASVRALELGPARPAGEAPSPSSTGTWPARGA